MNKLIKYKYYMCSVPMHVYQKSLLFAYLGFVLLINYKIKPRKDKYYKLMMK